MMMSIANFHIFLSGWHVQLISIGSSSSSCASIVSEHIHSRPTSHGHLKCLSCKCLMQAAPFPPKNWQCFVGKILRQRKSSYFSIRKVFSYYFDSTQHWPTLQLPSWSQLSMASENAPRHANCTIISTVSFMILNFRPI